VFLDASESGNDVFFLTAGKLVAGDTDNALDVYDAHVCGSGWECPVPPTVAPPCSNTSSCRGASESQPSVFGASGTATFSGAGNVIPSASPKAPVKSAAQVRREKLSKALRACRAKKGRAKRKACEQRAQRRYGAKRAKKATGRGTPRGTKGAKR
jgi:hypothetical protein